MFSHILAWGIWLINFVLFNLKNDLWLIDSNSLDMIRFYKDKELSDKSITYMFIEEGIIMAKIIKSSLSKN